MDDKRIEQAGAGEAALSISGLRTALKTKDGVLYPVDGVDLEIPKGKIVGLVGESGCGKSMMANSIMNLLPKNGYVEEGSILFKGMDLASCHEKEKRKLYGDRITLIFQDPMTSLNPVLRVGKQVEEVLRLHKPVSHEEVLQPGNPGAGAALQQLPAPAQRRTAPACDDQRGDGVPPRRADRRRAHHSSGRDHRGADFKADEAAPAGGGGSGAADHP